MTVPEFDQGQLSQQLERGVERILHEQIEGRKKLDDVALRVVRMETMLLGDGVSAGLVSRILLIEQRMHLVYCILGGLATLAGGTLWAIITDQ